MNTDFKTQRQKQELAADERRLTPMKSTASADRFHYPHAGALHVQSCT
jgi:hypothetical protein